MAAIDPRYRVVTFRISVSEYEDVYGAAEKGGARTVSEFARTSVLERAKYGGDIASDHEQLRMMSRKLDELARMVADLHRKLGKEPENSSVEISADACTR